MRRVPVRLGRLAEADEDDAVLVEGSGAPGRRCGGRFDAGGPAHRAGLRVLCRREARRRWRSTRLFQARAKARRRSSAACWP